MKHIIFYLILILVFINTAIANCPSETSEWIVSGIVRLKAKDNKKIRLICNKIKFLKNSKIIAYNDILLRANLLEGPVNIKTINGRKQSTLSNRTKDFVNPSKNHSVLIALKDYDLEKYIIDTSGFDGADGINGLNGKDQDQTMPEPEFGGDGGRSSEGQSAGDINVLYYLDIHDENYCIRHSNLLLTGINNSGGSSGKGGYPGLGGVYLNSAKRTNNGRFGRKDKNGAPGKYLNYRK